MITYYESQSEAYGKNYGLAFDGDKCLGYWYECIDCPRDENRHLENDEVTIRRNGVNVKVKNHPATMPRTLQRVCAKCREIRKTNEAMAKVAADVARQKAGGIKVQGQTLPYNQRGIGKAKTA